MAALVYGRGGKHIKGASLWYERYVSITQAGEGSDVLQKEADRALKKSVFELQLQLITEADDGSKEECKKSYQCLVNKGHILQAITNAYQACKSDPKDIKCALLAI
jgi:DNA repair ATPase RecN